MTIALITAATALSWAKVKLYYKTISSATASTSTADHGVENCFDGLEGTYWEATTAGGASTITYDAGSGETFTADYLGLAGTNFDSSTADYEIEVRHSSDDFAADDNLDLTVENADFLGVALVQEFTSATARYWKIVITPTSSTAAPKISILNLGELVELDYCQTSYDPSREKTTANVNRSEQGYVTGIHHRWTERQIDMGWRDVDSTLFAKFEAFRDDHGMSTLFLGWEVDQHPLEIYVVNRQPNFNAPLTNGGQTRAVSLSFRGRKE